MVIPLEEKTTPTYSLVFSNLHAALQVPDKPDVSSSLSSLSTFLVFEAPFLEKRYSTGVCKKTGKPRWLSIISAGTFISDVSYLRQQPIRVELWNDSGNVIFARGLLQLSDVPHPDTEEKQSLPPIPISVDLVSSGYVVGLLLGNITVTYPEKELPKPASRTPTLLTVPEPMATGTRQRSTSTGGSGARRLSRPTRPPPPPPPKGSDSTTTSPTTSTTPPVGAPHVRITTADGSEVEMNASLSPAQYSSASSSTSASPSQSPVPPPEPSPMATGDLTKLLFGDDDTTNRPASASPSQTSLSPPFGKPAEPSFFDVLTTEPSYKSALKWSKANECRTV